MQVNISNVNIKVKTGDSKAFYSNKLWPNRPLFF